MSTFQLIGNVTTRSEAPGQTVTLYLSVPDTVAPTLNYTTANIGLVPEAELRLPSGALIYLDSNNLAETPNRIETFIVETVWSGNVTQLLYFRCLQRRVSGVDL